MNVENYLHLNHPLRFSICGPSNVGKSVFLASLILNISREYDKIYIYSPSLHQNLHQKIIKSFNSYIPVHIIPNILNEKDNDLVIEDIVKTKHFEKSDCEMETYELIEELKNPQEDESNSFIILEDLNEKEINNDKIQALFKQGRQINLSIFIISQDVYELRKKTIRANGSIYHIFKPNIFRDAQNLYQGKAIMDMTLNELKLITSICSNGKYQNLTIYMTKDIYTGRYRLGSNSLFVPYSSLF